MQRRLMEFTPEELCGRSFLDAPQADGTRLRAIVSDLVDKIDTQTTAERHKQKDFLIQFDGDKEDELIAYNELLDILEKQFQDQEDGTEPIWKFKGIVDHRPKGNSFEVLIDWEDGSLTWEPLSLIAKDDPITCAQYAKEKELLDKPGWK